MHRPARAASPVYILNYIWDGDELADADLELLGVETAMYSIHCAGLVFVRAPYCFWPMVDRALCIKNRPTPLWGCQSSVRVCSKSCPLV
jgi:hypothetical protein